MKNENKTQEQAAGQCYGMYRQWKKEHNQDAIRKTRQYNGETQFLYQLDADDNHTYILSESNDKVMQLSAEKDPNTHRAVAVIGDRFYKGKFLPKSEIEKAMQTMNGAFHDINHWSTTYLDGKPNIEYIVGYEDDTILDQDKMITSIHIDPQAPKYPEWSNYVRQCQKTKRIPNVSVSFWASNKPIKASELPTTVNYQAQGYEKTDDVPYLYDLEFKALATVVDGQCNDKAGCGIGIGLNADKPIVEDKSEFKKLELEIEIEKLKQRRK